MRNQIDMAISINVTKEEIVANPVPFDAVQKEHNNQWYEENGQQRPGFSGFNHRTTALGHDPLLGYLSVQPIL